jgi:hypothetical protein
LVRHFCKTVERGEFSIAQLFSDNSHIGTRALQAYLILIGLAWNRRTITSDELSHNRMQHYDDTVVSLLSCIGGWCHENDLPPLAALIVDSTAGLPIDGSCTESNYPAIQQRVYGLDWYSVIPPSADELASAGRRAATR